MKGYLVDARVTLVRELALLLFACMPSKERQLCRNLISLPTVAHSALP